MTAPATVSEAELMQRTGLTQRAALKRELTRLRIRYFSSRGGVWTTAAALDAALGLRGEDPPERRIRIPGRASDKIAATLQGESGA